MPNDPLVGNQWAWGVIDAYEAWDITPGSRDIAVAVFDTGTDWDHEDLIDNIWVNPGEIAGDGIDNDGNGFIDDVNGWNFYRNNNDATPGSHGTHVSGTIGAVGDNGIGLTGVNQQVSIIGLDVFDDQNKFTSSSRYIPALNYIADLKAAGVNVVASNNSYGSQSNFVSSSVKTAIERNRDYNIMFVAAAGNDGENNDTLNHMPSGQPVENVIAVAASQPNDNRAGFSNWGKTTVHIAAPGTGIRSTNPNDNYGNSQGTSMASPHVAGLVGLVASVAPNASYHQFRDVIFEGGDAINWGSRELITNARINAFNSVQLAQTQINGSLFADANGDSTFDAGETLVSGFNTASDSLGDWKVYVDANSDGQFNPAEAFVDVNGNGRFEQLNETYDDANNNGQWDSGEAVINDVNDNGEYDPNDTFTDANGNGVWDDAETHANVQFNGQYTLIVPDGTHTIRLDAPSGVSLTAGSAGYGVTISPQQQINDIDFGVTETVAPQAAIVDATFYPVDGATTARFQVEYTDNLGIDTASLGNDDVTVTEGGFSDNAVLVGFESQNQGATVVATYSFAAPGGTWDASDIASYTVSVNAGAVLDVVGNAAASGSVGSITPQLVTPLTPNFTEDFESGSLGTHWHTVSEANGRIQVTTANTPHTGSYHLTMDTSSGYALNHAILHADLAGYDNVTLDFWWKDFGEEADAPDHVSISTDQGQTWSTIYTYDVDGQSDWTNVSINLDSAGLLYSDDTWIRFQQYDNVSIGSDGIAIDDIAVTASIDTTAPAGSSHTPTGSQDDAVDSIIVVFSEGIDPSSFDLADITAFTGPVGDLLPQITGYEWISAARLKVDFNAQTAAGAYTMTLGPSITDGGGLPMAAAYNAGFNITAPRVTSHSPNGNQLGTQSSITFNFSKTMDQGSASIADVASFTGSGGVDLLGAISGVSWVDSDSLRVDFAGQTLPGVYTMVLGPAITDTLGNAMDQDVDAVIGEATDDQYSATFTILAPRVTSSAPGGNVMAPQNAITFDFNAVMDTGSFDLSDVVSFSGPSGDLIGALTGFQWNGNQQLQIDFADQVLSGAYSITIGPDITDTTGTMMDQDQDGVVGEAVQDTYTHTFSLVNSAPEITVDSPTADSIAILDTASLLLLETTVVDDSNGVGPLTLTWSQIAGAGTATFESPNDADTAVGFDQLGAYTLQLLADDGDLQTTSTIVVNVVDQLDPPPPYAVPSGGLVVHYTLDETSGTTAGDSQSGDHPGTVTGEATPNWQPTGGQYGGALQLDGTDDYIAIANDALINDGTFTKRTVSVWFNADTLTGRQTIYEEGGGTRGLSIYLDGSTLYFGAWDTDLGDAWSEYITQSGVTAGTWHNATVVLDATGSGYEADAFRGYFNGTKVGEARGTQLTAHTDSTGLGAVAGLTVYHDGQSTTTDNFDGKIDEFLLYNRALDDGEIANLYAGIGPAPSTGFIESGGLLVVEAENYDRSYTGTAGDVWNTATATAGYSGDGYLISEPNDGTNAGDSTNGAMVEYDVSFETTGTYYVSIRTASQNSNGQDDSSHVGLNGTPATYGGVGLGRNNTSWGWVDSVSGRVTVEVTTAGTHTLNLWQREDGALVDKIVLSTDSGFSLSGNGPAESERSAGNTNVGPVADPGADDVLTGVLTTTLAGGTTDDNLPAAPGAVATQWIQVAGPGVAVFGDAADPTSGVTVDTVGTYTFRLIADDGQVKTADDVVIEFEEQTVVPATIAGRHMFFNHSNLDGNDPGAGASDDAAIAAGKSALLPGQTA